MDQVSDRKANASSEASIVVVDIYDQAYHLRGQNREYIESLAAVVDAKMRAVAAKGTTVDSLRVAVLAALNIADELASMTEKYRQLSGKANEAENTIHNRAASLSGLLDRVIGEERRTG
jgi:cell division protein ZapA